MAVVGEGGKGDEGEGFDIGGVPETGAHVVVEVAQSRDGVDGEVGGHAVLEFHGKRGGEGEEAGFY